MPLPQFVAALRSVTAPGAPRAELGIDVTSIVRRTGAILTGRLSHDSLEALDLGGPLMFMSLLAFTHLLVGKLHFGYILGWTVVSATLIWFVLNSMTGAPPDGGDLGLYACCCLLGYALLPLVAHSLLALLLPKCVCARPWPGLGAVLFCVPGFCPVLLRAWVLSCSVACLGFVIFRCVPLYGRQ